jgi:hypothetical protein
MTFAPKRLSNDSTLRVRCRLRPCVWSKATTHNTTPEEEPGVARCIEPNDGGMYPYTYHTLDRRKKSTIHKVFQWQT